MAQASSLVQRQRLFAACLGLLLEHARTVVGPRHRVAVRLGEGYVGDSVDKPGEDSPHIRRGTHFRRLGQDLILDELDPWRPIWWSHPAWDELGAYWRGLDPLCRWGGDFRDARGQLVGDWGHFSVETPEGAA